MNTLNGYSKSRLTDNYVLTAAGGHLAVGNAANNIPLNNSTVNTNLNADLLDGQHGSWYQKNVISFKQTKGVAENQGYVKTMWCGDRACEDKVKEVTGAPSRCMPFEQEHLADTCPICGKKAEKMIVWGRQY